MPLNLQVLVEEVLHKILGPKHVSKNFQHIFDEPNPGDEKDKILTTQKKVKLHHMQLHSKLS